MLPVPAYLYLNQIAPRFRQVRGVRYLNHTAVKGNRDNGEDPAVAFPYGVVTPFRDDLISGASSATMKSNGDQ